MSQQLYIHADFTWSRIMFFIWLKAPVNWITRGYRRLSCDYMVDVTWVSHKQVNEIFHSKAR